MWRALCTGRRTLAGSWQSWYFLRWGPGCPLFTLLSLLQRSKSCAKSWNFRDPSVKVAGEFFVTFEVLKVVFLTNRMSLSCPWTEESLYLYFLPAPPFMQAKTCSCGCRPSVTSQEDSYLSKVGDSTRSEVLAPPSVPSKSQGKRQTWQASWTRSWSGKTSITFDLYK